jgi:hypothetical protein
MRRDVTPDVTPAEGTNNPPASTAHKHIPCIQIHRRVCLKRCRIHCPRAVRHQPLLRASCQHCGRKNKPKHSNCAKCQKPIQINNKDDRCSEHGLGHLLNPADPENEDREWIAEVWLSMIKKSLGINARPMHFQDLPAVGRITVSSPALMRPFEKLNSGKKYCDRVKPFNFVLSCHVKQFGHPIGANPTRFHLIGPYNSDSRRWLTTDWIDQYSGKVYRITTHGYHGDRKTARVKTYAEVLREYECHPESKCADADGRPCGKQTIGLLQRRHIKIDLIKYIGKESNSLEDVEFGLTHSAENVYTEYPDPQRDEWHTKIVPVLQRTRLSNLIKITGKSRRMLIDARTGKRRPHPKNRELITSALRKVGAI